MWMVELLYTFWGFIDKNRAEYSIHSWELTFRFKPVIRTTVALSLSTIFIRYRNDREIDEDWQYCTVLLLMCLKLIIYVTFSVYLIYLINYQGGVVWEDVILYKSTPCNWNIRVSSLWGGVLRG